MSKQIDINHILIKQPIRISVDGVDYPITRLNIDVVREYWETDDEAVLDKLSEIVIVF
jgi:hypothetical protein